jgi:hypothetical protein
MKALWLNPIQMSPFVLVQLNNIKNGFEHKLIAALLHQFVPEKGIDICWTVSVDEVATVHAQNDDLWQWAVVDPHFFLKLDHFFLGLVPVDVRLVFYSQVWVQVLKVPEFVEISCKRKSWLLITWIKSSYFFFRWTRCV